MPRLSSQSFDMGGIEPVPSSGAGAGASVGSWLAAWVALAHDSAYWAGLGSAASPPAAQQAGMKRKRKAAAEAPPANPW